MGDLELFWDVGGACQILEELSVFVSSSSEVSFVVGEIAQKLRSSRQSTTKPGTNTKKISTNTKRVKVADMADSNSALNWTLRFKKHHVTVLLSVSPTQSLTSIKETLLNALKVRNITEINGDPVPESATEIELGVPVDRNELEQGWLKLEIPSQEAKDGDKKRLVGGKKSVLNTTPQGADLRDAQAIAFRFRKEVDKDKDELELQLDDPGFDVLVPSYDSDDDDEGTVIGPGD